MGVHHPNSMGHAKARKSFGKVFFLQSERGGINMLGRAGRALGIFLGPVLVQSPNPRFLHGPFPVGKMDWPLSSWGYGLAPFHLGIWIGPFPVFRFMLGFKGCSEAAWRQSVARVHEYLNHVVQEICWVDGLNLFNHCPHSPFLMTHFTDSMPIGSIGDMWSANLWNPK